MQQHIRQNIAVCDLCHKSKVANISQVLMHTIVPDRPGRLVCIDLIRRLPPSRRVLRHLLAISARMLNCMD